MDVTQAQPMFKIQQCNLMVVIQQFGAMCVIQKFVFPYLKHGLWRNVLLAVLEPALNIVINQWRGRREETWYVLLPRAGHELCRLKQLWLVVLDLIVRAIACWQYRRLILLL